MPAQDVKAPIHERHFESDFQDKYQSQRYDYDSGLATQSSSVENEEVVAYEPNQEEPEYTDEGAITAIDFGILTYVLIGMIVLAFVYLLYIMMNDGGHGLFRSSKATKKVANGNDLSVAEIQNLDMASLIARAEDEHNYRLAIRYYNLWTLQSLDRDEFIALEEDKTNSDYYWELSRDDLRQGFGYISYLYNYIWYGEFPLNQMEYEKARSSFSKFMSQIS